MFVICFIIRSLTFLSIVSDFFASNSLHAAANLIDGKFVFFFYSNSSIQYTRIWRFKLGKKNNLEKGYFCVSLFLSPNKLKTDCISTFKYNILVKDPEIAKIAKIQIIPKCGVVGKMCRGGRNSNFIHFWLCDTVVQ